MDLIPCNAEVEGYHLNWTGWGCILDLLRDCGANLDQAAGSNDGDLVDGPTALSWGLLLQQHLDQMIIVKTPDQYMAGGYRDEIRVITKYIENPLTSREDLMRRIRGMHGDQEPLEVPKVEDLTEEDTAWVRETAEFFIKSGGFEQW
jgi:hypothetical protein